MDLNTLLFASVMARSGFILIFMIASLKGDSAHAFRFWTASILGSAIGLLLIYGDPHYPYFLPTRGALIFGIIGLSLSCVWAGGQVFLKRTVKPTQFVVMGVVPGLIYGSTRSLGAAPDLAQLLTMATLTCSTAAAARPFFVRTAPRYLRSQLLVGGAIAMYSVALVCSMILISVRLWNLSPSIGSGHSDIFLALFVDQLMSVLTYVGLIAMSLEDAQRRMKEIATTDPLTGLANRRGVQDQARLVSGASHRAKRPVAVLIADIDHFKAVNDRYGHECGDAVLKEFARRLAAHGRPGQDVVGRWGGEEFLAVLSNRTLDDAVGVAERLCREVSQTPFACGDRALTVTVSIGVAEMAGNGFFLEQAVTSADEALYLAKRSGRNRVMCAAGSARWDNPISAQPYRPTRGHPIPIETSALAG
ncbi:GGDEF domain-containing protein [Methylobacterium sp. Leaf118]|uniref:GGDEF domain-containing protein n=1 Tax=Methylobacterium sp. Leaf118 TaxID=2876562 RepID=UPI001E59B62C|nr:GGDEF domain-containing protein [Methylobacterium sp. Leaf118]